MTLKLRHIHNYLKLWRNFISLEWGEVGDLSFRNPLNAIELNNLRLFG